MQNKRKQTQQTRRTSGTTDFLTNEDPLSKKKKYRCYKFIITNLKYVQNFSGDLMHS